MPVPTTTIERPKPRVSASFVAVAATLLGFVLVASFYLPVDGNLAVPPGGRAPASTMPPRCLELSYRGSDYTWLPKSVRLTGEVAYATSPRGPLYRAIDERGTPWEWWPAGPDSIDIASQHSPRIRIPARGERVAGRVGFGGYWTVWEALTAPRDWQVFARDLRCPRS
ncbi:MAG TPA: hypothetical protein VGO40_22260 [Longimicrobium sp.]|jgi:hypothetical protein|nr:hypothetical protein [Longimicrobium sp.]